MLGLIISGLNAGGSQNDDNDIFGARPAELALCPRGYEASILERKRRAVEDASLLVRSDANLPLCPEGEQDGIPFTQLDKAYKLPIWHCVFEGCTTCADNVAKGKSSEGELWHHIITAHESALSTIMWKHQLNTFIRTDRDEAEWMFHTSLVGRIVCKFLLCLRSAISVS